jgi:DNA-binding transcriptional ArsR family regulator
MTGDADLSRIGELLADRARSRILMALDSGRELSASLLAGEAGVSRSTASAHLKRLTEGGLITVSTHGRHRHYRLAGPQVADLIERMLELRPPAEPVGSLRAATRAAQLRLARTCYDHVAGRLGVELMRSLLDNGYLTGGDGRYRPEVATRDRPAGHGHDIDYRLTGAGRDFLEHLGVELPAPGRRPVGYCVDWTETRHHLAGQVGRGLCDRFLADGWIERRGTHRAVRITPAGADAFARHFGLPPQVLGRAVA